MSTMGELKALLSDVGVSTRTDGLKGDDRRQALEQRLHDYQDDQAGIARRHGSSAASPRFAGRSFRGGTPPVTGQSAGVDPTGLEIPRDMSLGDLKALLQSRGISNRTPGLSGAAKVAELRHRVLTVPPSTGGDGGGSGGSGGSGGGADGARREGIGGECVAQVDG